MVWDGLGWFRCGGVGGWRGKGFEGDDADGDVDVAAKIVKIEKRREEQSRAEERREEKRRERNPGNLIHRLHRGRETSTSHDSTQAERREASRRRRRTGKKQRGQQN